MAERSRLSERIENILYFRLLFKFVEYIKHYTLRKTIRCLYGENTPPYLYVRDILLYKLETNLR